MREIAEAMVAPGKGIFAMDESTGTCTKRFEALGIESTEETRRQYRQLIVTTPNLSRHISGAILFDETIRQKADDGTRFVEILKNNGIIPGIKVDQGSIDFEGHPGEKIIKGLDGLKERLQEYHALGARFAKWRAVINIGPNIPSDDCLSENARILAQYAKICQEVNIVPMVEPEVIMDGIHDINQSYEVTDRALKAVFKALNEHGVQHRDMILKPNMVISGLQAENREGPETVVFMTNKVLAENVPEDIPGIAFLSGGQSDEDATLHLKLLNEKHKNEMPWNVTFSYGRGLQREALKTWSGNPEKVQEAQAIIFKKAEENGKATLG